MDKCPKCGVKLDNLLAIKNGKCNWCKGYIAGFIDGFELGGRTMSGKLVIHK